MKVLYFAWLRTKTGCAQEDLSPPAHVGDVAALVKWLKQRSPAMLKRWPTFRRCAPPSTRNSSPSTMP